MVSTFSWLDYSERERRQMLDAISRLGERDTRDELGLGLIRDAFADLFFPGTSTVQTRARYFLFIPWIYSGLEARRLASSTVAARARAEEVKLIDALLRSGEHSGVIGQESKEHLQRLPSSIYWHGVAEWGIRLFAGPQDAYHRSFDALHHRRRVAAIKPDDFDGESLEGEQGNWHHEAVRLKPDAFPEGATLALTHREADFLRDRILARCDRTLLAWLARELTPVRDAPFAWDIEIDLPEPLAVPLDHARTFSEVVHGAQLLYNLMLADLCGNEDWREGYRADLGRWWRRLNGRRGAWERWDRQAFWTLVYRTNPRVSARARRFVDGWVELVLAAPRVTGLTDGKDARELITAREVDVKKGLSRLQNVRARERWPGASGTAQLDFRWGSARRLLSDIRAGLVRD